MTCSPTGWLLAELCVRLSRRLGHRGFGRLPTVTTTTVGRPTVMSRRSRPRWRRSRRVGGGSEAVLTGHQQNEALEICGRMRASHLRNGLLPVLGEIPQQRGNHRLAQPITRAAYSSGRVSCPRPLGRILTTIERPILDVIKFVASGRRKIAPRPQRPLWRQSLCGLKMRALVLQRD